MWSTAVLCSRALICSYDHSKEIAMPVITISREYGSGGREIAQRLCETLGYTYFDKELMVQVASEMDITPSDVIDLSEDTYKMRTFTERLFGRRRVRAELPEVVDEARSLRVEMLSESESIRLVRETILAAYEKDNVVIVGRGGQAILREKPGVLHVRLIAPLGGRALHVKEREGLTLGDATERVRTKDAAAVAFLERFFHIDWNNPLLYHMIINTGKWESARVPDILIAALMNLKTVSEF
jgi:CMP/dCMP kinase